MSGSGVQIAAAGGMRPPAANVVAAARRREEQGFDAIWWADHLLHWFPTTIWEPDLVPQAATGQRTPHVWFDPFPVVAAAGAATERVRLAIGVTDLVRHHPATLAQTALTLDHLTGGRFMLGVGTGEAINLTPFGLRNDRPMGRLEEGLEVLRLLFSTDEPVDHRGEHFTLEAASMGVRPFGEAPPPIWLAAHRPRGLALTGRLGDGWMPLATTPEDYRAGWAAIAAAAERAGRSPADIERGLYVRVVLAESDEEARRIIDDSLLMRFIALTRPAERFEAHGAEHPIGPGSAGITDFLPTRLSREEALALAARVPDEVVRETVLHGSPDDVARGLEAFVAAGARHIQIVNMTPLAAPSALAASEEMLGAVVERVRAAGAPA